MVILSANQRVSRAYHVTMTTEEYRSQKSLPPINSGWHRLEELSFNSVVTEIRSNQNRVQGKSSDWVKADEFRIFQLIVSNSKT